MVRILPRFATGWLAAILGSGCFTLQLAAQASGKEIALYPVSIHWDNPEPLVTTDRLFSINGFKAFFPEYANNPAYNEGLSYLNPGLLRMHNAGMHNADMWVDDTAKTWNRKKIQAVLDGLKLPGEKIMINISRWPSWMDKDGDRRLDEGQEDAFANFCAELVEIVNVEQGRGVRYFEITNECDFVYWREQLSSGNENELLGTEAQNKRHQPMPDKLADIYIRTADAMKAVDPTIKTGGPAAASGSSNVLPMHRVFIEQALPGLDFFSFHGYPRTRTHTPEEIYDTPSIFADNIRRHVQLLKELSPDRHIELHLNEFNIASNWRLQDKRMHTEEGAVFDALFMVECARAGADVLSAWNECDSTYGKMDMQCNLRIPAHIFHFFNAWLVGQTYAVSPSGVTDGPEGKSIVAFAVKSKNGEHNFVLINRAREPVQVQLNMTGWRPATDSHVKTARVDAEGLHTSILTASALAEPVFLPTNSVNFFSCGQ
ncbi:MAG: hypothetical protein Q7Q73_03615 [Verrucomicrobiota bacterium JB024]|nr:hypothetical protein [Verrucomicrobiota bacterium JB024]